MRRLFPLFALIFAGGVSGRGRAEVSVHSRPAVLVIGGFQTHRANYSPYLAEAHRQGSESRFFLVDSHLLGANHVRDRVRLETEFADFAARNPQGVVVFAFSIGAKFAARLALEHDAVKGLFLVDPVDGGSPVFRDETRFPDFLPADAGIIEVPTVILESEHGATPVMLGMSCVPPDVGPNRFAQHVSPDLLERRYFPRLGHVSFLAPPLLPLAKWGCAPGKPRVGEIGVDLGAKAWAEFLTRF